MRVKKTAGVTDLLTPHYGRVWLITTLAEAGMPIPAIGRKMRQRDPQDDHGNLSAGIRGAGERGDVPGEFLVVNCLALIR